MTLIERRTLGALLVVACISPLTVHAGTWADRAKVAAQEIIQSNSDEIAKDVLQFTHPSGNNPRVESVDLSAGGGGIRLSIAMRWKGGFSGGEHVTTIWWELAKAGHVSAAVVSDTAPFAITPVNAAKLNSYFEKKLYPVFEASMSDSDQSDSKSDEIAGKFACETAKATAVVVHDSVGTISYAAWTKPKRPTDKGVKPDVVISGGTESMEGTGPCVRSIWKFEDGNRGYVLSTLGCTQEQPPEGANGQLEELINGLHKKTSWCSDPSKH